jgi:arsenate reductase
MSDLTVYEKPTCTTCRSLFTLLTERGIDFERVNYHVDPLPESKIRELIKLMAEHPQLLQRPIVEKGNRAVLARPVDRALDLL